MTTTALTPMPTRAYSARELRAAAAALAAGCFADQADRTPTSAVDREQDPHGAGVPRTFQAAAARGLEPLLRVRAANAGAGASTIALALTDAADAAGVRTRLLDAAAPAWSGLLGATATELGARDGWRRGRRGASVLIDRVENPVLVPVEVPAPRPVDDIDLTVLDAGWSLRELTVAAAAGSGSWLTATPAQVEVIVTRPDGLALSQTEAALAHFDKQQAADRVVVVVVGAHRWSNRELAQAGRLLREAHGRAAVLFTPVLARECSAGLGPDPLPKQLTRAGQRLLNRITSITGPLPASRH